MVRPTCVGETLVFACPPAEPPGIDEAKLVGERPLGGRDRVVGRRLEDDPVALVVQGDG